MSDRDIINKTTVVVQREENSVILEQTVNKLIVSEVGAQGPPGPPGPQGNTGNTGAQGPQGIPGRGADQLNFTFEQQVSSNNWNITHNLGYRPNVTVQEYGDITVEGEVTHLDANQLTISFNLAIAGYAYLS